MINMPLPDLDKMVKIHHDNAEVKKEKCGSQVVVRFSCFKLVRFSSVGLNFEWKISKLGAGGKTVTFGTA